ncbi:D-alanyl-D-alanine carboxypeptidase/D-alanyl-D-alanine endopeptidase [Schaalia vaccimaxillae]|uniref:D-alanyl-D-alanine carboxypeptidase/D-alanyl-D-alanine endopeptidase n=1 Tax=Schaalia vaccimaxillae TaxID=183916 RepID=UPI0003B4792D|nr:D-alanyl-D-alanine carboxypeptidase/D-alanyl-D-alanine-endopeptidase [Schaalia vaccimaxillae]
MAAIVGACAACLALGGYVVADVQDRVLGLLTTSPQLQAAGPPQMTPQSGLALPTITAVEGTPVEPRSVQNLWASVESAAQDGEWKSWGMVIDASTGEVLLDAQGTSVHTPASITKVVTAFTALSQLNGSDTLTTGTKLSGTTVYLWSEGDLLLSAGTGDKEQVSGHAGLADLAADTAAQLRERQIGSVTINWPTNPFAGDAHLPAWTEQGTARFEGQVSAMAIDAGRTSPGAYSFSSTPAADAAQAFAQALAEQGIEVTMGSQTDAPEDAEPLASVESATVAQQVRWMLHESDNTLADQYCRLAADAARVETSYAGAVSTVRATLESAGIPTDGMSLGDCSGLSEDDRLSPETLVQTIRVSMTDHNNDADELIRSLPWAGLQGSMASRLDEGAGAANVQAKTGSLSMVASLSGVVSTSSGRLLIFAIGNEDVPDDAAALTRPHLDNFVEGLANL